MNNTDHVIKTNNKFMEAVGLSAFTTGDLYSWMTANNGANLGFLYIPSGTQKAPYDVPTLDLPSLYLKIYNMILRLCPIKI